MLDETRSQPHQVADKQATELKRDLQDLHVQLLAWEEKLPREQSQQQHPPLSNPNILNTFSKITTALEPLQHFDCFSFARAVLHSSGHDNVPLFRLAIDPLNRPSFAKLGQVVAQATALDPELYFSVERFQENVVAQGTAFSQSSLEVQVKCSLNAVSEDRRANYLLILQVPARGPAIHIHGMIILGEDFAGNDLWILHRNDSDSPPSISKVSTAMNFWRQAYSDRFVPQLTLLLSKPIAEIEPLPHPKQELIDGALAIVKRLDREVLLKLNTTPYHGAKDYFAACANALISKEPEALVGVTEFLTTLNDQEAATQIQAKLAGRGFQQRY